MNILFIGKRFYTNRDAVLERYGRIFQLPFHWAKSGLTVKAWLIDYHSKSNITFQEGGLDLDSTPIRTSSFWRRVGREFSIKKNSATPNIIVASGDAYIGLLGYLLARRLGAKFVFDVYDKYDEFSGYRQFANWDTFSFLLRKADLCFFASQLLKADLGRLCLQSQVLPNGVDTDLFKPLDMSVSRAALGLDRASTFVGYFGSMEPDRGVDDLIEAIHLLRKDGMQVELLLAGKKRADLDVLKDGIQYLGNISYNKMPIAIASCDAVAVPYRRSTFMDSGASNKIAEALFTGRPLIATETPNFLTNFPVQAETLSNSIALCSDPPSLSRIIARQLRHPIKATAPSDFAWDKISSQGARSIEKLLRN